MASFWTPANIKRLKALVQRGQLVVDTDAAAQLLGTSAPIVLQGLAMVGIAPPASWTKNAVGKLKLLVDGNGQLILPVASAAVVLGCAAADIPFGLGQLGGKPQAPSRPRVQTHSYEGRVLTKREIADLRALCVCGRLSVPTKQAAKRFSIDVKTLRLHLKRLGIALPLRAGSVRRLQREKKLLEMSRDGVLLRPMAECKEALGCSETSVRAIMRYLRIVPGPVSKPELDPATLAEFLEVDVRQAEQILRRNPRLLRLTGAQLHLSADAMAAALSLPRTSIITAIRRKPNLVQFDAALLQQKCAQLAKLLGVTHPAVATAFIQSPALLQVKPDTIDSNLSQASRLLLCDKAQLARAFLKKPALLTMRPAFLAERMRKLGELLEHGHAKMLELVLAYPYLLTFADDTTAEKAWLLVKLSKAVCRDDSPAEILTLVPMAFSYAKERIAQRVEMARAGRGPRSIGGLLHLTDKKADELMSA